jgi:short-subunit dehydrogenase
MSHSSSKRAALITGVSRGIGAVYADRLAKQGYDLILVARNKATLQALAASLFRATGRHIIPIVADLDKETDIAKVETELKDDPSITMLVTLAPSKPLRLRGRRAWPSLKCHLADLHQSLSARASTSLQ